tara:strand:- start:341 stop:886 length:546 start_codon:yes stop_codon:yes gene_type:complete
MDDFMFSDSTHSNAAQCFFSKASTETFDWEQAYLEDPETVTVMQLLLNCHDKPSFTDEQLQTVSVSYKTALKDNRIQLVNGKLVLYKPFQMNTRCVALVIVPASLRKKVFSHFMLDLVQVTWVNTKHFLDFGYDSSGLVLEAIVKLGSKAVRIALHSMYGALGKRKCIFHGQLQSPSTSCT